MTKQKTKKPSSGSAHYPIKLVVRRTGLSGHLIRMWERRYQAVKPVRTVTNRRVYTDAEIRRLEILGKLTRSGHTISAIANLPTDKIEKMLHVDRGTADGTRHELVFAPRQISSNRTIADALKCIGTLDAHGLKEIFLDAEAGLGQSGMLRGIITPLMDEVEKRVQSGKIRSVNENLATAVCRRYVDGWRQTHATETSIPTLLASTLEGDWHECGAIGACSLAGSVGWLAIYLGPSLSAEELAKGVQSHSPEALILNISAVPHDKTFRPELVKLHQIIGKRTRLIVIGDGAKQHAETIQQIDASRADSPEDLEKLLASIRKA